MKKIVIKDINKKIIYEVVETADGVYAARVATELVPYSSITVTTNDGKRVKLL